MARSRLNTKKKRQADRDRKRQQRLQVQAAFVFSPPNEAWKVLKVHQLHLPVQQIQMLPANDNTVVPLTMPTTFRRIVADGNCYFRCISFAITGSEQYHHIIRENVCQYMRSHPEHIRGFLLPEMQGNIQLYLQTSKMEINATWATEVEIFATAYLLQTNIYVYAKHGVHWTWVKHSPPGNDSNTGIYIVNCNQNHYEIVLAVQNSAEVNRNEDPEQIYNISQPRDLTEQQRRWKEKVKRNKDVNYQDKVRKTKSEKYKKDRRYRSKKKNYSKLNQKTKYARDSTYAQQKREAEKLRYTLNKQHRLKKKLAAIRRYTSNNALRTKIKRLLKFRYMHDSNVRQQKLDESIHKYSSNTKFKRKVKNYSKAKYAQNKPFRDNMKAYSKTKYAQNKPFRHNMKAYSKTKYAQNKPFRDNVKAYSKTKYAQNKPFRDNVKAYSKSKYARFHSFRHHVKLSSVKKYARNPLFRHMLKTSLKEMYHKDKTVRELKKKRVSEARKSIQKSVESFRKKIQSSPTCVCTVCIRLLYKNQVKKCIRSKYMEGDGANIAEQCLTGKYVQECLPADEDIKTDKQTEWICYNCHRYLSKGEMPPQALANNLMLPEVPDVLQKLNVLERQLIAMRIPFMKLLSLPRGGQKGVKGPVVNVPTDLSTVTTSLPRTMEDAHLIKVKLKRKLSYKGYYNYQWINPSNVIDALIYLKEHNKWYKDVIIDSEWIHEIENSELVQQSNVSENGDDRSEYDMDTEVEEDSVKDNQYDMETDIEETHHSDNSNGMEKEIEETHSSNNSDGMESDTDNSDEFLRNINMEDRTKQIGKDMTQEGDSHSSDNDDHEDEDQANVPVETCFQPVDIGQDYLDTNKTLCLAPGENQSPQNIFEENGADAMAFPTLLCDGNFGISHERAIKLSPAKYFNARLFSADTRFSTNKEFVFFAQYMTELNYIRSHISLALRKGQPVTNDGRKVTAAMLVQSENLSNILKSDLGYRFLQPVRGTPPYWQRTLKDLYAMIRQLGIPTWFVTFSAAEMRWKEVTVTLQDISGDTRLVDELEWADKSSLVMDNPVMCARMFDHRVKALFTELILSKAAPVGNVVDFFYRTEFQQRGSPHIHCLLWVQDAPKLNENSDEEVCRFIDQYVTCVLPNQEEDPELFDIISSVQIHNKKHGKSCTKYQTACRFGFPRPPIDQTFIARTDTEEEDELQNNNNEEIEEELDLEKFNELTKKADRNPKRILRRIWELVSNAEDSHMSFHEILEHVGISYEEYTKFLTQVATRNTIHVKRSLNDIWVNNYNADLSRAWNANLDIQYVTDCYACVAYILSYISKAETEMGDLLQNAKKEAEEGNKDAVTAMRQIGNVYLQNREVSAQEAIYRVCGLHLKESSRDVIFAPAGKNITKMSLPISVIQARSRGGDDENIWMTSIHERYYARPNSLDFEKVCLAEFCSKFRILPVSQRPKQSARKTLPVYELQNGLGFIKQCKAGKEAVVRYPRFDVTKNPDDFYLSMLQLFVPHRTPVTLPEDISNFEEYVRIGMLGDTPFRQIIDENRHHFEIEAESLEKAWKDLQEGNVHDNAWGYMAPEAEAERIEIEMERVPQDNDGEVEEIPELYMTNNRTTGTYSIEFTSPQISKHKLQEDLRSMNTAQCQVFYKIRHWCRQVFWKQQPDPFHLFLTGGAGTGKSHLIRCIYHTACGILKCIESPDCHTVLLTAPTGTAAFNIDGATLHSAFNISRDIKLPYQPLTEDSLNALRNKLDGLQILIIDEVSMVSRKILTYVHGRLCQLKHSKKPFGGVSILAVGDFFQLSPVGGQPLYKTKESDFFDLWKENFTVATLDEIMRQKNDKDFAAMLNRLRTHKKEEDLLEEDKEVLLNASHQDTPQDAVDALHIFARNVDVNKHNNRMIVLKCNPIITSVARDFDRDQVTGQSREREKPYQQCARDDLQTAIKLGVGARIMLTRNIDTDDGLVNGAFGVITAIDNETPSRVKAVYVKFDNDKVGRQYFKKTSTTDPKKKGSVKIEPVDATLKGKRATRKQLPLRLGYASTIHKVQGMTASNIVVSLKNIHQAGMAYVGLSRATSLQGLHILDFDPDVIFASEDIIHAILQMPSFLSTDTMHHESQTILTILHHNTEGLLPHLPDVLKLRPADVMCFTETWFENSMTIPASLLPDHTPEMLSREDAFKDHEALSRKLTNRGGVCIFTKESVTGKHEKYIFQTTGLEAVAVIIRQPFRFILTTVYRSQNYPLQQCIPKLREMLHEIQLLDIPSIIVGDFNDNALHPDNCKIIPEVCAFGYSQLVNQPTTDSGSCLDLVFVKGLNTENIKVSLQQTYYSVHDAIRVSFTS